ncbi:F-box protein At3g07870-like [Lycium barbarum]|uniref:F-box protein At3g07870-like n=1 Tax=Lycium barbarum TaxID=112863 RepID=UPI00293F604C|nr:F-box protein At3g07870-like [Lycium barbarum]
MAMRSYFHFLILTVFVVLGSSSMEKKTKNQLLKAAKDGKTSTSSSSQRETNLVDLPFDIIINIVNRLPFKSVFQFHRVCKSWRSLISTPRIAYHINHVSDKKYTLMRSIDVSRQRTFKIPIDLQFPDFMLLPPVNGILCICEPILSHVTYVYLWNPLTHEFKALPKPSVHLGYVAVSFGFGFVPNSNDYKVVRVLRHERKPDYQTEIYSLNRNTWKRISKITGNERDVSVFRSRRYCTGALTVDLEKEVITEADYRKHCRTITWSNEGGAILLTFPEDDLMGLMIKNNEEWLFLGNL